MIERRLFSQLLRFAGVGVVNSAIYFVLAAAFSEIIGLTAFASSVLAYIIAAAIAYLGHKFLTFAQPVHAADEVSRFVVATGIGLSLAALIPLVQSGFAPMISFVTVLLLVPACSFLMMKFFVFKI